MEQIVPLQFQNNREPFENKTIIVTQLSPFQQSSLTEIYTYWVRFAPNSPEQRLTPTAGNAIQLFF